MAHYAELGVDNIVKRVLFVTNKDCMTEGGIEKEEIGDAYLQENHGGTWVKCSQNTYANVHLEGRTPLRANFPSIGWYYNSTNNNPGKCANLFTGGLGSGLVYWNRMGD